MGSRQSFSIPHSRVPSAMIGQYTLKPDTHSNRDTGKPSFIICDFMSRLLESEANAYTHVVGKQFSPDMGRQRVDC